MFQAAAAVKAGRQEAIGGRRRRARKRGGMSDEDVAFIDEIWAKYDSNDDGSIGFREVKDLMTEINEDIAPSDREVKMLVKVADADNSGTIDKQELRILIGRWFVLAEEKNRKWNLANFNREVKQAFQGCMHVDHVEQHAVVKSPGEKEANFWKNTTHNMVQNYSKPNTAAHSEIGSA
mmetsp:Transcript_28053/g.70455  ORF Transcript_28053/g.70455 Transcript_28053/m.70455 type:complete len:178 (-) Transcript_28053:26-559(-)